MHVSGAGTKETFYYTALDNLLDGIGQTLKLRVRCVMQLKSLGAGNPDGGLFHRRPVRSQDVRAEERRRLRARRGRSQGTGEAIDFTAASAQVAKYWNRYRLVLVTNLRERTPPAFHDLVCAPDWLATALNLRHLPH